MEGKPTVEGTSSAPVLPQQPVPQASLDEAREDGRRAGAAFERQRLRAILTDPLAADRMDAAKHLAFGTSMTDKEAIAFMQTVAPATLAQALQSLPATVARACNTSTGLVAFDAAAGAIASVDVGSDGGSNVTPSVSLSSFERTPDPHAAIRKSPEQKTKSLWKKITGDLNADGHAIQG
ncbi:hypothetical protein HED51_19425 [Ochrobactrum grignonense]|nr:hypothetical protein [Brucella grignonensis]NKB84403.1 hypothetical protein [Brucella grignonensis]